MNETKYILKLEWLCSIPQIEDKICKVPFVTKKKKSAKYLWQNINGSSYALCYLKFQNCPSSVLTQNQ